MAYNNMAFKMDEPPDGTRLVIEEDLHMAGGCPSIIWRDEARSIQWGRPHDKARWFKSGQEFDPRTWGEIMVYAIRVYAVGTDPVAVLEGERHPKYSE